MNRHTTRLTSARRGWCRTGAGALLLACAIAAGSATATATAAEVDVPDDLVTSTGLRATVFGPDPDARAELPEHVRARELSFRVDGARPTPQIYWFNRELRVWFSAQSGPAELVIVIAGTGGGANTANVRLLRRALYADGYHVLTVPSPTTPRFLVAASSTGVGGDLTQDAADLRRAIRQSLERLPRGTEVTGLHAIGYSLGGANAAVIKALDDGPEPLGVERVVMINPPVSLFTSVERMDRLFRRAIGDDDDAIERFYQRLYADLSALYQQTEAVAIDESFLYGAAARLLSSDEEFAAAIALTFRLALIDLFFAGDLFARTGVVVDSARPPRVGDSLDDHLRALRSRPFRDYFDRVFAPFYLAARPHWTRERLVRDNSLELIADSLRAGPDYYAQHTADDPILGADELAWLRDTLGERIVVYETGGHLGNLGERRQIEDMLAMLRGRWPDDRTADR